MFITGEAIKYVLDLDAHQIDHAYHANTLIIETPKSGSVHLVHKYYDPFLAEQTRKVE